MEGVTISEQELKELMEEQPDINERARARRVIDILDDIIANKKHYNDQKRLYD